MKKILRILLLLMMEFALLSSLAYAKSGLLFKITQSGSPLKVDVILCLNGKGPASCQDYSVSAQNLDISTTIMHHYPIAGIKVLTPGYQATGCIPYPNGYCLFAVNGQQSTPIKLNKKSPAPGFTIGGTISGLEGSVSLQNTGG